MPTKPNPPAARFKPSQLQSRQIASLIARGFKRHAMSKETRDWWVPLSKIHNGIMREIHTFDFARKSHSVKLQIRDYDKLRQAAKDIMKAAEGAVSEDRVIGNGVALGVHTNGAANKRLAALFRKYSGLIDAVRIEDKFVNQTWSYSLDPIHPFQARARKKEDIYFHFLRALHFSTAKYQRHGSPPGGGSSTEKQRRAMRKLRSKGWSFQKIAEKVYPDTINVDGTEHLVKRVQRELNKLA